MKLVARLLLMVIALVAFLLAGLFVSLRATIENSLSSFERQDAIDELHKVIRSIEFIQRIHHDSARSVAKSPQALALSQGSPSEFVSQFMTSDALSIRSYDVMMVLSKSGAILHAKSIQRPLAPSKKNSGTKKRTTKATLNILAPRPQILAKEIGLTDPRVAKKLFKEPSVGFVLHAATPMMVSIHPLKSSGGTSARFLITGRYLGEREIKSLNGVIRAQIELDPIPLGDKKMREDYFRNSQPLISQDSKERQLLRYRTEQLDWVSQVMFKDLQARPVMIVSSVKQRQIPKQAQETFRMVMIAVVLISLAFTAAFMGLLKTSILARLYRLTYQVEQISPEEETRIELDGNDEFNLLADKTNELLGTLFHSKSELSASQEELQQYTVGLERLVDERTRELSSMNSIFEIAVEGIGRFDSAGVLKEANLALSRVLRTELNELLGKSLFEIVNESEHDMLHDVLARIHSESRLSIETERDYEEEERIHQELVFVPIFNNESEPDGFYCFMKDITARKDLEEKIYYQAYHDNLTGLPNRLRFNERLFQALRRGQVASSTVAVMFIDLDNFKYVNDSLGHTAGDELLCIVARRLSMSVRPGDVVARMGGDEFTVLLEGVNGLEEVTQIAERTVRAMRSPVKLDGRDLFVTFSIGIGVSSDDTRTPEQLLRNADTAMYQAKERGKAGYAVYDPSMNKLAMERLQLETGLRTALEQGHLRTYFQPIIALATETVSGAEALVRWEDPDLGLISPARFIPLAEETGLVIELGEWILRDACMYAKAWNDQLPAGKEFVISVNLSTKQIQKADIVDIVDQILKDTLLPPRLLKLEVTESAMMVNVEATIEKLVAIKALGVQLALDDFGTGYSSLSYLSKLPVDTVKVDQSFINVLGVEQEPTAIAGAIITLSQAMKKSTTAEGVETRDQLRQLQMLGCTYGQGYLFSRPIPATDFEERFMRPIFKSQESAA